MLVALLCSLAGLTACHASTLASQPDSIEIRAELAELAPYLTGNTDEAPGDLASLEEIYAGRQYAPLWIRDGAPTPQAVSLIRVMCRAQGYGLRPEEYLDCARFEQMLGGEPNGAGATSAANVAAVVSGRTAASPATAVPRDGANSSGDGASPLATAGFDIGLTSAARRFLGHVHFGRISPSQAGFDLTIARPRLDIGRLLGELSTTRDPETIIAQAEPPFEHYKLLRQALSHYRQLASGQAVPTRTELSTAPYDKRIRQIELTLERWRWLPSFDTPPIIVNIPQFRLFAFQTTEDRKADILQMDVIVGRTFPKLRTPVFAADLKYVIFRPYWDVPYSITQKEMLPDIRRKPGFLAKQHMELVDGQGDTSPVVPASPQNIERLAAGKLRLRQQPGEDNALGLIKFMLPNQYNVYLHSTPAHRLFAQSRRAFSHGCIRVSDPVALAQHVLRNAAGEWTAQSITEAMNGTTPSQRVNLRTPIRVLILYGTALATEDGAVLFFDDIYGHDRRLEALLGLLNVS
jgi:murein L,D-transpeptidase YcbB/YkuD